jgi:hypothetical protein
MRNYGLDKYHKKIIHKILISAIVLASLIMLVACDTPMNPGNTPTEVTITFVTGVEDFEIEPIKGRPNTNIVEQADPERDGYRFTGWIDETGKPYRLTRFPQTSITLTASWSLISNPTSFIITFITNSNEYVEPIILKAGETIPELAKPKHHTNNAMVSVFTEWTYDGDVFNLQIMPQMNLTLVANWRTGTNVVWFESENYISPVVASPNEKIYAPKETPIKDGYTFIGWKLNNRPYIFDVMPNSSITLIADFLEQTESLNNATTSVPKLFINLDSNKALHTVTRDDYVKSSITLSSMDESFAFNGLSAEFKGRGHGSWTNSGPKRGYRIKFYDKYPVFGHEDSRHWVLLAGANFYDTTMLRNMVAYQMSNELFTNIEYASHTQWVELYVNGLYRGVYVLAEHIRVDKGRVDIDEDYGILDTGYMIEYDAYAGGIQGVEYFNIPGFKYGFTVSSPNPNDVLDGRSGITEALFRQQVNYIREYMTTTLTAALGGQATYETFAEHADVPSFVDMYILNELLKNTDTGWSSFYMYKKAGGKLYAGPPWDFDASAGKNRGNQTPQGIYVAGSVAYESSHTASELYIELLKVPAFKQLVAERFKILAPQIETFTNAFFADAFIDLHKETLGQNFYHWSLNRNIEGMVAQGESAYTVYANREAAIDGWVLETQKLRLWILNRTNWLKNEWD